MIIPALTRPPEQPGSTTWPRTLRTKLPRKWGVLGQHRSTQRKIPRGRPDEDEFTKECLALPTERRLRGDDVLACRTDLFTKHGPPDHIRSDNPCPAGHALHA